MKKLINDVQDVLDEQLAGLAKAHPSLTLHQDPINSTPSPPSICMEHSKILSGVGEVKISPGQAPESIP